jgi:hypothetical protein
MRRDEERRGGLVHLSLRSRAGLASLALALVVAACSNPPAATSSCGAAPNAGTDSRGAALDDTLQIQLGRSASADGGRLILTFVARLSDSRCPANAVCVWMGDAVVRVAARAGPTSLECELHTGLEPRSLAVGRYIVRVVGLLPYPGTEPEGVPAAPPTVVLRVVR